MNYTMDASYRTRAVRTFLKAYDVKGFQNPDPSFLKKMAALMQKSQDHVDQAGKQDQNAAASQRTEGSGKAAESADTVLFSPRDMTMEEYKEYLYDKISQLPVHPTNMQDDVSIQISQAGLEAMKNDPEYEQWVLSSIRSSFMSRDPWSGMCGGKYVILYFGAEKEQSRGECLRAGHLNGSGDKLFNKKAKNSFWERRARRREELAEQYEEMLEVKELNKDLDKGFYYGSLAVLSAFKPKPEAD
ncbi:MAG: hypothetical protein K2P45_07715 [Eubacterium sp.]|nr:hypothetical protein [Eubacterium sp.]